MTRAAWKDTLPPSIEALPRKRQLTAADAELLTCDILLDCAGHSPQAIREFIRSLFDECFKAISVMEEAAYNRTDWPGFTQGEAQQQQARPRPGVASFDAALAAHDRGGLRDYDPNATLRELK